MTTGADAAAIALRDAGVELAFGLPGAHNLALWRALADGGIRLLGSRHEQGAVYAADGFARSTGQPGIALTTTGPGAANTLGAVGEAWASHAPVVVLSTDIPTTLRRPSQYRGVLHECVDQAGMFRPVTKAAYVVADADAIAATVRAAVADALGPPRGPVYVQIPTDLLSTPATGDVPPVPPSPTPRPTDDEIDEALVILSEASAPVIWAGGGARDAGASLEALAARLAAPVITTFQARGALPADSPWSVNVPPHEPPVIDMLRDADAVLVAGSDLDGMMTQNWKLPLPQPRVAVNVDADDATKNYAMDLTLVGDAGDVLGRLADRAPRRSDPDREGLARELERYVWAELQQDEASATAMTLLASVRQTVPPDAVIFADMAICGYWLGAYHPVTRARGLHYPMGWGTLGYAFPAAIGAATAIDEPVVSFSGDGGILFALGELALVSQERLPLTVVVVDDGGYGMLRYGLEGDPRYGTELAVPDYATVARGMGITAYEVEGVGSAFAGALEKAVAAEEPVLIHARAMLHPPRTTSPRWPLRDP